MWLCSQIGAREHYAIPRALHQSGRLETLYTDFWAGPKLRRVLRPVKKGGGKSLATRWHPELEKTQKNESLNNKAEIISWNTQALWWERMLRKISVVQTPYHGFIEVGRRFALRVREDLKRRKLPPNPIFFSYDTGALEAFEWCRANGIRCVLGQMDPNRVEVELVHAEEKAWPGWALNSITVPEEYFVRREQEWALADRIVVNSEFSRQALLQQGVPPEKLVVIPLCFETAGQSTGLQTADQPTGLFGQKSVVRSPWSVVRGQCSGPLRVLFLGQVILRKGIQYLMEAARRLEKEPIQFDVVGPIGISREAMAKAPANLQFHGRANRNQTAEWYRQADLFVLPTISDGFAITQIEAMVHGLPVVTTPNCGQVVDDGVDGLVVPPRDATSLARAFQRYLDGPELLSSHSAAAQAKAKRFSLNHLAVDLEKLGESLTR